MRRRWRTPARARGAPLTIMAVNLYHGGHHPQHLETLVKHWPAVARDAELHIVVSEAYTDSHPGLLEAVERTPSVQHHLVPAPALNTTRRLRLAASDRLHGDVVAEWAPRLGADHVLLMYFDHVQLSLALDLRFGWPLQISGIFFRPVFHYGELGVTQGPRERAVALRKRLVLGAAVRNPHLRYLFCLDQVAAEHFPRISARVRAIALPEPMEQAPGAMGESPLLADVEPGRRRLLMFGSLDERKGVRPVLEALSRLRPEEQSRLALVLAGRVQTEGLRDAVARFGTTSRVQVVSHDRYLDEQEIQPLIASSDLVLLTYTQHIGSSGILVRAAGAGVPVLSTNDGLLGSQVSAHRLGTTVDSTSPSAISAMLGSWLADDQLIRLDRASASRFAAANTAEAFADTILSRLLQPLARA